MASDAAKPDLEQELIRLRTDQEAIPWAERCDLATALIETFKSGGIVDREAVVVPLLNVLADDPKWEVRKIIAEGLQYVRPADLERVGERLSRDSNAFVRRAVEFSKKRRRKDKDILKQKLQGIDLVLDEYERLKDQYGEDVAKAALSIGETYHRTLAGNMAHEMRNDLAVLDGRVAILLRKVLDAQYDPAMFQASLEKIHVLFARLIRLVEEMLAYSKSRATPMDVRLHRLDDLVGNAIDRLQEDFLIWPAWKKVLLEPDLQSDLTIQVTRLQFEQAVYNILKNAYEAFSSTDKTPGTSRVVITGKVLNAEEVVLTIEDNGIGIGGRDLAEQKVFVPGRTTKPDGYGLGLSIAKNYIEIHDGRMIFHSEPGKGTTVTIIMPCAKKLVGQG